MNNLTKNVIITSLILLTVGFGCMIAGYAFGDSALDFNKDEYHFRIGGDDKNDRNRDRDRDDRGGYNYGNGYGSGSDDYRNGSGGNDYGNGGYSYGGDEDDMREFFEQFGLGDEFFDEFFGDDYSSGSSGDDNSGSNSGDSSSSGEYYY